MTTVAGAATGSAPSGVADRPGPPAPPAVIARDEQARATVRAVRLATGIRLDGVLDEPAYETVPALDDFIQQEPNEGAPASEKTEAWVLFDATNIYISARLWDSAPPSAWVANEMQRDTPQLRENDTFWVAFDTFNDRRNGVAFYTNPLGALGDFQITNEGNPNGDWNPVWDVRTGRFDGGWTVEMEIPFKSVRYRPGPEPVWGIQFRRMVRRKNERSYLTPVPISAGRRGLFRLSDAAMLVGLELPAAGTNLEIKPYTIGGTTTDVSASPPTAWNGDAGVDVKYGITQNLTADFTYNTDFAQVEVDEQQVNLTRFSLFFPEKREFFLEGRGIFEFARGGGPSSRSSALRQIGGGGRSSRGIGNAPTLFYSRQIGLQGGAVVPIVGGGRVTGKVGDFDVGALNIQTGHLSPGSQGGTSAESTNFAVVRIKRDILRRSAVGGLFTNRSVSVVGEGAGANRVFGADATLAFYENVSVVGYVARTQTPGFEGRDVSYQGQFMYAGDRYGVTAEHLVVEDNFIPEVGFLRRDNFRRSYLAGRFSPRPASLEAVRQFRLEASYDYILTADTGILETKQAQVGFNTEFETSDRLGMTLADNYEFLVRPFEPGPGVVLPVGGYGFRDVEATYQIGAQRRLTGIVTVRGGEYFNGNIWSVGFSQGRLSVTPELSIEPTVSENWIDTPYGSFHTRLIVSRVIYTFSPRMFFGGLIQYNSATNSVSTNLRLRWEYSPGSELFVVYTEDRDTDPLRPDRFDSFSLLRNRGLVVKVNRLFRL
ncbi:MAG: carbohydrate binding family 9 domain-containing protein [Acidobacteria bacterium]|nr:carbohydrate binding family 9 domain-containing protein [Acidobacteriota bacterium]MYJ04041.1 carbohydrate binding family 9 domain-containing protein [Acidobacteriota bacterium]